jgi:hypothetical protein
LATVLSKVKRAVRSGNHQIGLHCLDEIAADDLTIAEVVSAILNGSDFDKLTEDESHVRYRLYGLSSTNREIVIIVFFSKGTLYLKTVYEPKA